MSPLPRLATSDDDVGTEALDGDVSVSFLAKARVELADARFAGDQDGEHVREVYICFAT